MASLWLGATYRRPAVELLTDSGERLPLPLPTDDSYVSDHALDRSGWVAVQVGYQVIGLRDGDLLRPSRLPDAWGIAPAADPSLVLVRRYFGESRGHDDSEVIELVDMDGRVVRSVTANVWGAVGELRSGWVVTMGSLLSWEGEQRPLPAPGEAIAVLSGRHLVIVDSDGARMHIVDAETGRTTTTPVPPDAFWLSPVYNIDASQVAFAIDHPIAIREHEVLTLDPGTDTDALAWIDRDHVLQVGQRTYRSVHVVTGASETLTGLPARSFPRVNISGRFDPGQLRDALLPAWSGPVPEDVREGLLRQTRDALVAALHSAGLPADELIRRFVPGVRLRSCFAMGRVPVGASHFGGRPDLPAGHKWPMYDGQPMMFIGQIRADEINAALPGALPSNDVLVAVFAAIEPDGGYPVEPDAVSVHVVPLEDVRRLPWPKRLPDELRLTLAIAVPEPTLTLPSNIDGVDGEQLQELLASLTPAGPRHQMFGSPDTIQDFAAPPDHQLLLQFDGDPLLGGPDLGDGGRLLIWSRAFDGGVVELAGCIVELDSH
ncbi:MAG: DUF1963 domain-containing protein [Actinomycetota bacterium]|nr:DUF1963 domain-containing protein [Actinomycetota bacterium]